MSGETDVFRELVDAVVESVEQGLNVLITGSPGSGQSTITDTLYDELAFDRRVARLAGLHTLHRTSFAGLAGLEISEHAEAAERSTAPPQSLAQHVQQLRAGLGLGGVLLIERPEWLDSASAGAIALASRHNSIQVVAISNTQSPYRGSAALMRDLEPGMRIPIPRLSFGETHALARDILGGPVESETVARIATQSAGLYDLVKGLTTVGKHSGALTFVAGQWRAIDELVGPGIGGWVEQVVAGATDPQRDILRRLAAASVFGEEYTPASADAQDLGELMDIGLVTEQGGRLSIYPPMLADYVKSQRHTTQRDAVSFSAASTWDMLPALTSSGAGPDSVDDVALSHRMRRKALETLDTSYPIWSAETTASAAAPLLVALQTTGASEEEIRDVIDRTKVDVGSQDYVFLQIWWATYRGLTGGRLDEAVQSLEELEAQSPRWRSLLASARAHLLLVSGTSARSSETETDAADELGLGLVVALERQVLTGAVDSPSETPTAPAHVHPVFRVAFNLYTNIALMLHCRIGEAIDAARAERRQAETALNLGTSYTHAYAEMFGLVLAGRLDDAHELLNRILTLGTARALHEPYHLGTLDLGAMTETLRGEPRRATMLAEMFVSIAGTESRGGLPGAGGVASHEILDPSGAAERTWATALACADTEQLTAAIFAGVHSLGRHHDSKRADTLAAWSRQTRSPLLQLFGRYGRALDRESPEPLLALATEFRSAGAGLYFGRSRVQAALAAYEHGDVKYGFQLAADTWADTAFMGSARTGLFQPLWSRIALTPREVQIARLGATATSSEIASTMHLSQRTVENYLYSTYRKTGAPSRESIAAACGHWLREPDEAPAGDPAAL